jgi:AraC-like DNA-binding protein
MEVIFISGIFLSFFIVVLLLTKKPKSLTDNILAVWIAIIGIHLLGYYFKQIGYWETYPHLIGTTAPMPLFHGPMLYLYTLYSLRYDRKIRSADYLHFVPALAAYLYMSKFFFFYTPEEKILLDNGELKEYMLFSVVLLIAILISGITYAILAYRLTIKHKQKIENNFSYREGINIKWLRNCILGIGMVFLSATIIVLVRDALGFEFSFNADYIIYIILIGLVFYIGYFGIKQENIFSSRAHIEGIETFESVERVEHGKSEKYRNSGMKSDLVAEMYGKLLMVMDEKKPYLDPKISLSGLAQILEISPNQLSQIINQESGVNFHDFINNYRVEEFIRRAQTNKNFSLLALALDSGFNSKSSFNHIFKKQKGLSPSKFLAENTSKEPT